MEDHLMELVCSVYIIYSIGNVCLRSSHISLILFYDQQYEKKRLKRNIREYIYDITSML